jgi:hypothetical protein
MLINTFTLINATEQFWIVLKTNGNRRSLTSAYLLYGYLCHQWNGCGRPASFKKQTNIICAEINLSKPTLDRQRQILKNAGLIDFVSKGKGDPNITYQIKEVTNFYYTEMKKEKNFTSPVTSGVTSDDNTNQSTEKELFVIVEKEVKNFYYLKDLFENDVGLTMNWAQKGYAAAEFKDGVEQWMIQNNATAYHDFTAARKHFLFWMPNFKLNETPTNGTIKKNVAGTKATRSSDYARGF